MASKEFLRKLRQKHHLGEYRTSKKSSSKKRGAKTMAKKHYSRHGKGSSMKKMFISALAGAAVTKLTGNQMLGAAAGAGAGLVQKGGWKAVAVGAGAGYFEQQIEGTLGNLTGMVAKTTGVSFAPNP